jgi:hypothetical protein
MEQLQKTARARELDDAESTRVAILERNSRQAFNQILRRMKTIAYTTLTSVRKLDAYPFTVSN